MARKVEEEEASGYNWMDTYGDMVTLLLCFFVLLYSFSTIDAKKWQELVAAFSGEASPNVISVIGMTELTVHDVDALDPPLNLNEIKDKDSKHRQDGGGLAELSSEAAADELYMSIKSYIENNNMQGSVSIERTEEAIYLRFNEMALFNSGEAEILPRSKENFGKIMQLIYANKKAIKAIRIEGHTDNVPIHTSEFADNWDLSAKRATNVLRLVLTYGYFEEDMLSAVGYGEFHPVATNDNAEGRAQNRRVDFVLIRAVKAEAGD